MTSSYYSFLIRIWKTANSKPPVWHASLEVPSSHVTVYFQSLEECLVYLQKLENGENNSEPDEDELFNQ
jgi:hypothetical protein